MTEKINSSLKKLLRPISELKFDKKNARKHGLKNLTAIMESLNKFGQQKPIIALKTGVVIAGNGTLEAAKKLGLKNLAVVEFDSEKKAHAVAYALADNRTAELAEWDWNKLNLALEEIKVEFDPLILGFSPKDVTQIMSSEKNEAEIDKPMKKIFSDDEIIDEAFRFFRRRGFPYPHLELYKMKLALNKLVNTSFDSLIRTTTAYRIADTYNKHRFSAAVSKMKSPTDNFKDDKALRKAIELEVRAGNDITDTLPFLAKTHGAQGCYNFRPGFARFMYEMFCVKGGKVFDPSMGYGGRLVGFLASHCSEYIGTDPNVPTFEANKKLFADLKNTKKGQFFNSPIEDLNLDAFRGKLDFAFTSPPYFVKELYSEADTQSCVRYPEYNAWLEGFLAKMFEKVLGVLKSKSVFAVNIEDVKIGKNLYPLVQDSIEMGKKIGFKFEKKMEFPLPVQTTLVEGEKIVTENFESVLIFKK